MFGGSLLLGCVLFSHLWMGWNGGGSYRSGGREGAEKFRQKQAGNFFLRILRFTWPFWDGEWKRDLFVTRVGDLHVGSRCLNHLLFLLVLAWTSFVHGPWHPTKHNNEKNRLDGKFVGFKKTQYYGWICWGPLWEKIYFSTRLPPTSTQKYLNKLSWIFSANSLVAHLDTCSVYFSVLPGKHSVPYI